jgi:hypothetical protein
MKAVSAARLKEVRSGDDESCCVASAEGKVHSDTGKYHTSTTVTILDTGWPTHGRTSVGKGDRLLSKPLNRFMKADYSPSERQQYSIKVLPRRAFARH